VRVVRKGRVGEMSGGGMSYTRRMSSSDRRIRRRGPETAALHFLIITDCPSYTAVHRRRSGLSCCRCPYLEQSASTRHVHTLYVCFPRTPKGFPLQTFLSLTRYRNFCSACAVTVVIFGHFNRSFLLFFTSVSVFGTGCCPGCTALDQRLKLCVVKMTTVC